MALQRATLDNILTEVLSDGDAQLQEVLLARHECRRFVELSSDHTSPVGQTLEQWLHTAYARMAKCSSQDSLEWRMLYTDISLAMAIASCRADPVTTILAEDAVCHLDKAIILAGAPGEGRHELILELISAIQAQCLPTNGLAGYGDLLSSHSHLDVLACTTAQAHITRLDHTPSFISFVSELSRHPFVLSGFAKDCPALTDRPWSSAAYLRSVAGPGRQIPVEVGIDYRTDDWTQKLMSWDAFLGHLSTPETNGEVLYLAQHDLFKQFPVLANDISVPDYAYASLPATSDYPRYQPPRNDEQLVMNVWLGPRGAISPAHTDPFHNFYTQIVGSKTVWLAPPSCTPYMSTYDSNIDQSRNPAQNKEDPCMSNTSRIDVFDNHVAEDPQAPGFRQHVIPNAIAVTLLPGDVLFFPAGWWHAMRSEATSFSVSMWF